MAAAQAAANFFMFSALRSAIALFLLAGLALAQSPAASPLSGNSIVAGQVLKATDGSPLRNAALELVGLDEPSLRFHARSDSRGVFAFRNLPPARYQLRARRIGYSPAVYRSAILLTAGQEVGDVVFRLQPEAVVIGKVVDDEGEPRPGVEVRAISKDDASKPARAVVTNDLGEYRLYGLAAGEYFLSAVDTGNPYVTDYDLRAGDSDAPGAREYAPTFYPGTIARSEAAPVRLDPGQELRIDFKLLRARLSNLVGRVRTSTGRSVTAEVVLEPLPQAFAGAQMRAAVRPNGSFIVRDVLPGSYALTATAMSGDTELSARQHVEVTAEPLPELNIVVAPLKSVRGRVTFVGGGKIADAGTMMVWLRNRDGENVGTASAQVEEDGTFTAMPPLPEGTYDVELTGAPGSAYLRSAQVGIDNALQSGVLISNRSSLDSLELTVDPAGAQVAGVLDEDRRPAAGETLRIVGDDAFSTDSVTDDLGIFNFVGLRPGEYRIFIADAASPIATVSVSDGEQKVLRLTADRH